MAKISRIRNVDTQREMERTVDDFVTRGWEIIDEGQNSRVLREKNWGSVIGHIIVAVLTAWWTLFVGNIVYALVVRYGTAEKILIQMREEDSDPATS